MEPIKIAALLCAGTLFALGSGPAVGQEGHPHGAIGLKITPLVETTTTITGQPIRFPHGDNQLVAVVAEVAPGGQVGRHMHPVPLFVYMLEGRLDIEVEGHGTHTFSAGEGFAEVINTWHNGRNLGDTPARFLIVFSGQKGTPNLARP